MSRIRTFLAVPIAKSIRSKLILAQNDLKSELESHEIKISWARPETLHLTFIFIGDVDSSIIPDICKSIDPLVPKCRHFICTVARIGAFPNLRSPRVLWAGCTVDREIVDMQPKIQKSLRHIGVAPDAKVWRPHLTLGRVKNRGKGKTIESAIRSIESMNFGEMPIEKIVLFRSELTQQSAIHTPLHGWSFE